MVNLYCGVFPHRDMQQNISQQIDSKSFLSKIDMLIFHLLVRVFKKMNELTVNVSLFNFWFWKTIYWVFSVVMILHTCWGHCRCFHTVTEPKETPCSLILNNTNNANIIFWHIMKLMLFVICASHQFKNQYFVFCISWIGVDFNRDEKTFNLVVRFWVIALPAAIVPSLYSAVKIPVPAAVNIKLNAKLGKQEVLLVLMMLSQKIKNHCLRVCMHASLCVEAKETSVLIVTVPK